MKDRKIRSIEDMSFDELVDYNTQMIHSGLLEGGGRGLRTAVYMSMDVTIRWRREMDKLEQLEAEATIDKYNTVKSIIMI
jgi:hypothetical protein